MKRILILLFILMSTYINAQVIGADVVNFTAKTEIQMNAITVAQGLQQGSVCYRSDTNSLWMYNGTTWNEISGSGLQSTDIDTFAELDAIVSDTPLARLSGGPTTQTFQQNINAFTNVSVSGQLSLGGVASSMFLNPHDTQPGSLEGNIYWDNSENRLKGYDGTSWKTFLMDGDAAGASLPVSDATSLVEDPVDGTKEMRIDVGAVSTATTRTLTMPDADVDLGNLGAANLDLTANYTWSGTHTFTTQAFFGVSGIRINNATNDYWTQGTVVGQSPGFVFQSYDEAVFNTQYALNFSGSPVNTYDLTPKSYVDGLDHTDDQTASEVNITDANDWFSGTDVETAIEEIGSDLATLIDSDTTGLGNAAYKPISKLIVHDYSVSPTPPTLGTNEYALQINGPSEEKSFVIKWGAVGADIAAGTGLEFIAVHDAITITRVEAYLDTAPTGSVATFDINEDGVSILSTKLTIDAGENWSDTALTAAVISDTAIDALSKLSIDVDGVGSTVAGADPQITIYYTIDP